MHLIVFIAKCKTNYLPSEVSSCGSTLVHKAFNERARQRPTWTVCEVHQNGNKIAIVVKHVDRGMVISVILLVAIIVEGKVDLSIVCVCTEWNDCSLCTRQLYTMIKVRLFSPTLTDWTVLCINKVCMCTFIRLDVNSNWQFFPFFLYSSSLVGKQRSNANMSICTNDIQSVCHGYLHTYQYGLMTNHERKMKIDFPIMNKLICM